MKRILFVVLTLLLIFFSFPIVASANDNNFNFKDVLKKIDNETKEYLDELGIDEISFEDIKNLSIEKFFGLVFDILFNRFKEILKTVIKLIATIIITATVSSFVNDNSQNKKIVDFVSSVIIVILLLSPINETVAKSSAVLTTTLNFVIAYLPIMFSVMIASQNYGLAYSYNSSFLFLTNIISFFADKVFVPLISSLLTLNIFSSFSLDKFNERLFKIIKKTTIFILSFFSLIYSGFLTSKSIVSIKSDSMVLRGFKFISGRFIPIVGTGVSETLSQIVGSFSLLKTSFGFFVIIVIFLINLPVILELLCWNLSLQLCAAISDLFGLSRNTSIIENFAEIFSLINVIVIFITILHIVSTGIVISIGK